ncbi:hypothetical protein SYNPS1DRAFT_24571, partial [Syncephalis pseudoplumigaleata]
MKFPVPPPYAPYCDYNINISHCNDATTYFIIYAAGTLVHLCVFFWGVYIITRYAAMADSETSFAGSIGERMRHFISQPLRPASIFSVLFLGCRIIHNTLCAYDFIPSLEARTLTSMMSMLPGFWATLLFAAGIVETVQLTIGRLPPGDDDDDDPSHHRNIASHHRSTRVLALAALVVLGVVGTILPTALSLVAGMKGKARDWTGYLRYLRIAWCTLGTVFVALGILYGYYAVVLSRLLRQLAPKLLQSS